MAGAKVTKIWKFCKMAILNINNGVYMLKYICGVAISFILVWVLKEFGKLPIDGALDKPAFVSSVVLLLATVWKLFFSEWDVLLDGRDDK